MITENRKEGRKGGERKKREMRERGGRDSREEKGREVQLHKRNLLMNSVSHTGRRNWTVRSQEGQFQRSW